MTIVFTTDLSDPETAGRPMDQTDAEPLLQQADPAAQSGARYPQFACGGGETALLHHLNEEPKIIEILPSSVACAR